MRHLVISWCLVRRIVGRLLDGCYSRRHRLAVADQSQRMLAANFAHADEQLQLARIGDGFVVESGNGVAAVNPCLGCRRIAVDLHDEQLGRSCRPKCVASSGVSVRTLTPK